MCSGHKVALTVAGALIHLPRMAHMLQWILWVKQQLECCVQSQDTMFLGLTCPIPEVQMLHGLEHICGMSLCWTSIMSKY